MSETELQTTNYTCPYCGGTDVYDHTDTHQSRVGKCASCHAIIVRTAAGRLIVTGYNSRPDESPQVAS